jgi:hypothetical protein
MVKRAAPHALLRSEFEIAALGRPSARIGGAASARTPRHTSAPVLITAESASAAPFFSRTAATTTPTDKCNRNSSTAATAAIQSIAHCGASTGVSDQRQ